MSSLTNADDTAQASTFPRRTVVRAGAWTVPVVATAVAAPAYAVSECEILHDYSLVWGTSGYTRSSGTAAYFALTSSTGGDPIYVHFTTTATTTNAVDTTRNLTLSNGGTGTTQDPIATNLGNTGQLGIRLQHNNTRNSGLGTNDANAQVLKISFRKGTSPTSDLVYVRNVSFCISDIDALSGGNNYADRVSLSPNPTTAEQAKDTNVNASVSGGGNTTVSVVGSGTDAAPWYLVAGNASSTTPSNNNIDESSAGTKVRVTYANTQARSMQELTMKYWSNVNTTIYHRIYLTNITFKARIHRCG